MSANGPPSDLITPPGFHIGGTSKDAAPDSVIAQLRRDVRQRRASKSITFDLPPIGSTRLRVTYGTLGTDEVERYVASAQVDTTRPLSANLEVLARACRSIEAYDAADEKWAVLEDDVGPVTFDDRLTRLLGWERPGEDFRYPIREVYSGMFGDDGFALMTHFTRVAQALGLVEADVGADLSTSGSPTRSAQPPRSG